MLNYRPILFVIGIMVATLGAVMLIPAGVDVAYDDRDWQVFLVASSVTIFIGLGLALSSHGRPTQLGLREAFILTTATWVALPTFAALPFAFAGLNLSYTDAFFEAMSGLTTTGATIIVGLDNAPPGILIWRALLQWLGGVGIIVTAVAVLPLLRVGGMQLFRMESSDSSEKVLPRAGQIAATIGGVYVIMTAMCSLAYFWAGMSQFDAVAHAMTTIATGGFSTSDASIAHFESATIDYLATAFMILGSLPFLLYFQILRGHTLALWQDHQVRGLFLVLFGFILTLSLWRMFQGVPFAEAFRYVAFNVTSIVTGTGYASDDYMNWGGFAVVAFFFMMFVGGCAGSTACGIKIFRFQVLFAAIVSQIKRLIQPNGVFIPHFNRRPIPESVMDSVMSFFFLFILVFLVLAAMLNAMDLDLLTSLSASASALANVGPGLGEIVGPTGTYASLPDMAKWLLAAAMLFGRLELFTVFVLFMPGFWRG